MMPEALVQLRHRLHASAETAFEERETAAIVCERLEAIGAQVVLRDLAGNGILARLNGEGPRILLRADLDALPLKEASGASYAAQNAHHACGHDGHMAMLLGALEAMVAKPPCDVWALFQPAEETGKGMAACLDDSRFPGEFDAVLAFHNVPGHPLGSVLVRPGTAAVASTGLVIDFEGATSHAAEPQAGRNPIPAAGRTVPILLETPKHGDGHAVAALVQIQGGGPRFGTSAGDCRLAATLRAGTDEALERMVKQAITAAGTEADRDAITIQTDRVEPFPATVNDAKVVDAVVRAGKKVGAEAMDVGPFPWSEDFGHATAKWPGALVGVGSGMDQPNLHAPSYDFPDSLIDPGAKLWVAIVEELA